MARNSITKAQREFFAKYAGQIQAIEDARAGVKRVPWFYRKENRPRFPSAVPGWCAVGTVLLETGSGRSVVIRSVNPETMVFTLSFLPKHPGETVSPDDGAEFHIEDEETRLRGGFMRVVDPNAVPDFQRAVIERRA